MVLNWIHLIVRKAVRRVKSQRLRKKMCKSISKWIDIRILNPAPYQEFTVLSATENCSPDVQILQGLMCALVDMFLEFDYYLDMIRLGGKGLLRKRLEARIPKKRSFRLGDFGEVLLFGFLIAKCNYRVPYKKIARRLLSENQQGYDLIAIKIKNNKLEEILFIESKLRTKPDTGAAKQAYKQLGYNYRQRHVENLEPLERCLRGTDDSMRELILDYMFSRETYVGRERFLVGLIYDEEIWNDACLANLAGKINDKQNLKTLALVVKIADLENLIARVCSLSGIEVI